MSALTLAESLAICTYKNQLTPSTHRMLADWLDCYKYILPADRDLNESALMIPPRSKYDILHIYYFIQILECNYSPTEQSNITREILCHPQKYQIVHRP